MRYWLFILTWLAWLGTSSATAGVAEGFAAYQKGDYATAHKELSLAAKQDHPVAQNILATMYIQGVGVPRDYRTAMDWLYRAQALGMPEAMFNLARMYEEGLGEPKNPQLALKYYREAAIAGFRPAIQRLEKAQRAGEFGLAAAAMPTPAKPGTDKAPHAAKVSEASTVPMPVKPPAVTKVTKVTKVPKASERPSRTLPEPELKLSDQLADAKPANAPPVAPLAKAASAPETKREPPPPVTVEKPPKLPPASTTRSAEQQVEQQLSNYLQRERVLYVGSNDARPALAAYLSALRGQLQRQLKTTFAGQPEVSLIISVAIRRDGRVHGLELTQSAGQRVLERAAMARLREITRMAPLPQAVAADYELLDVSVRLPIE